MHLTLQVATDASYNSIKDIQYSAPHSIVSEDENELVLFSQLPINATEQQVIDQLHSNYEELIWNTEGNFTIFQVRLKQGRPIVHSLVDRYGSKRVFHQISNNHYLITTDWRLIVDPHASFDNNGLSDVLSSRILTDKQSLFKGTQVSPLHAVSVFDDNLSFTATALAHNEYTPSGSQEEKINVIENELINSLKVAAKQSDSVSILLSGGVDSFLLAALSRKVFKNVVAYTPTWNEEANPELERAVQFAKHLNIEHKVITITTDMIGTAYESMITSMGTPIRNYSSLALYALMEFIDEPIVVYGEFADTLFGSSTIKGRILDLKYLDLLRPFSLIPKISRINTALSRSQNLYDIINVEPSLEPHFRLANQHLSDEPDALSPPFKQASKNIAEWKKFNIETDCRQHMVEIEVAAAKFGKYISTPFYTTSLINFSSSLTEYDLYGPKGIGLFKNFKKDFSSGVKILLKELACRYIGRDHIYKRKLGFPTPRARWIDLLFKDGLLRLHQAGIIEQTNFEYLESNYEWIWTQLNLLHIKEIAAEQDRQS